MKAVITDLDRTLLRSDKSISPYTLDVLRRCRQKGMRIMAASARALRDLKVYDDLIGFDAITATNGAVVSLPQSLCETGIPRSCGEKLLAALVQFPDAVISIEAGSGLYSSRDIPAWKPTVYTGFPALPDDTILYKILVSSENGLLHQSIADILTPEVYHTIADGKLIQIMSTEATKWSGIQKMLDCFAIDPADAIYFGDDNDDILPLQKCGMGVAVSNAIPAVRKAADCLTDTNDADGVAAFLEDHFLS